MPRSRLTEPRTAEDIANDGAYQVRVAARRSYSATEWEPGMPLRTTDGTYVRAMFQTIDDDGYRSFVHGGGEFSTIHPGDPEMRSYNRWIMGLTAELEPPYAHSYALGNRMPMWVHMARCLHCEVAWVVTDAPTCWMCGRLPYVYHHQRVMGVQFAITKFFAADY